MKKCIFIALCLTIVLDAMGATRTYADHSMLSSGKWVKIRVSESGVHKITYSQLADAGLNPQNVRIYGYGGAMLSQNFTLRKIDDLPAVAFWMEKGSDQVFGEGDYILFYAQANFSWSYNDTRGYFTHTRNPYSDYGYYFLTDDAGEQHLIAAATALESTDAIPVHTYTNYQLHEKDYLNLLDVTKGCDGGGREFYGETFYSGYTTRSFAFQFPDLITSEDIHGVIDMAAYASAKTTFTIQLGSSQNILSIAATSVTETYTKAKTGTLISDFTPTNSENQSLSIRYNLGSQTSALGYLNYIELSALCRLVLHDEPLFFRTASNLDDSTPLQYNIANANSRVQVWDITCLDNIYAMPTTWVNDTLSFIGTNQDAIHQYVAIDPTAKEGWKTPTFMGSVTNQDLHALSDIDFVIITPKEFMSDAQRLAEAHETKDQLTTAVVTDEQVYNEFSSGTPDATAYRWLMKMLYDRGVNGKHKPSSLLLFGDGTFDNRQLLISPTTGISTGGKAWLLTYQTVNSTKETDALPIDDYFAFMDDNEGTDDARGTMEFGVGRFPITSTTEAKNMTDKAIAYLQNTNLGSWKNQLLFIADDGDGGLHTTTAEAGAERVRIKNPDFIVNKVYLDAYPQETGASGESYPLAKNKIDNLLNQGVLYMNYSGHGGYNGITNEGIMNINSIQTMTNANQGLWMLATCSFAHYDSGKRCAAEEAVLSPSGAALAVMSACRTVYANQNAQINRWFCDTLFGHRDVYHYEMTMGQATRIAKNKTGVDANKLAYVLLGDPAIRLNYPTQFQVRTTHCTDTIKATSTNLLTGEVIDSTGTLQEWFNGKMQVWIYDKMQQVTTRDNDEPTETSKKRITYNDYSNLIYSGEIEVIDGTFTTVFMAPKDIRYNYGSGRIVYYASDTESNAEAVGHYEQFIVGGSSPIAVIDTTGPDMHIYLNNSQFKDGGETHEYPHFFADLEDEHGINTVGSGIGHDLLLVVDDDPLQTYVLNSYFQIKDGDFTTGQVSYKMDRQLDGQHQLRFRAWDLLNNSATQYLNYTVVTGRNTEIYRMVAYPNPAPASSTVTISIDYDHPDELVETQVYFYDMTGRMSYFMSQDDAKTIQCDLSRLGLTPGVYTYQVKAKTKTTSFVTKTSKLIVTY